MSPRRVGDRSGELNERRYRAMKKISFMAQKVNKTFWRWFSCQMLSSETVRQTLLE
jgi:hypothetical protein